jgi:hypothetical protein
MFTSLVWANAEGVMAREKFDELAASFDIVEADFQEVGGNIFNENGEADFFTCLTSFREMTVGLVDEES